MNPIIKEIFEDVIFTEDESTFLYHQLEKISLKKGDFLLKEGEEIKEIFYVHTGCLRSYFIDKEGKEHILQFAVKAWWISDYITLYGSTNTKAVSYIECIQEAVVYRISKREFDRLCEQFPRIGFFYIKKMEGAFASFQNRILENLTLTAKDRYLNFVNAYPTIERKVKNYHIASFLGITTESLSRIRKEISLT